MSSQGHMLHGTSKAGYTRVGSVCFSPDGNIIASGSDDTTLIVWSVQTGAIVTGPFEGHSHWISAVVFLLNGKRVRSGSEDRTIRVCDTDSKAKDQQ